MASPRGEVKQRPGRRFILLCGVVALAVIGVLAIYAGFLKEPAPREVPTPAAQVVQLNIAVSSEFLDFGDVPLDHPVVRQLVLRNDGSETVSARLSVSAPNYKVTPQDLTLLPDVAVQVAVTAEPAVPGELRSELRIDFGQSGEPLIVVLDGRATERLAGELSPGSPRAEAEKTGAGGREVASAQAGDSPEIDGSAGPDDTMAMEGVEGPVAGGAGADAAAANGPSDAVAAGGAGSVSAEALLTADGQASLDIKEGGYVVLPFDPATSTPLGRIDEPVPPVPDEITAAEEEAAREVASQIPGGDEALDDMDLDDPLDTETPTTIPTLTISGLSTVTFLGAANQFSPQQIEVFGSDTGGPFGLSHQMGFPLIPLAFGDSMFFGQVGAAMGVFDPLTGQVTVEMSLEAVDMDGDAAPFPISLSTGTSYVRNDAGLVVAIAGVPRDPGSGLFKLVGAAKIPRGFRNGGENRVVYIEILATLQFAPSIASFSAGNAASFLDRREGGVS